MGIKLIICDIDNTLFFTDALNTKSYIESAKKLQLNLPKDIITTPRITSGVIKHYLPDIDINVIEQLKIKKLNYFQKNLDSIKINKDLLNIISKYEHLCLWTASVIERAIMECDYFNISYDDLISFDKESSSIKTIEKMIHEWIKRYGVDGKNNILVVDDDASFLKKIEILGYRTLLVKKI